MAIYPRRVNYPSSGTTALLHTTSWSCHGPDKGLTFDYFTALQKSNEPNLSQSDHTIATKINNYFLEVVVLLEISY